MIDLEIVSDERRTSGCCCCSRVIATVGSASEKGNKRSCSFVLAGLAAVDLLESLANVAWSSARAQTSKRLLLGSSTIARPGNICCITV